jgi:hypothetical protein
MLLSYIDNVEDKNKITKYLDTLDDKEKKALEIAMDHLKSSFDIKKSVGYTKWLNKDK